MFPFYHGKHYIKGYDQQFAVDFYILFTLLSLSNARVIGYWTAYTHTVLAVAKGSLCPKDGNEIRKALSSLLTSFRAIARVHWLQGPLWQTPTSPAELRLTILGELKRQKGELRFPLASISWEWGFSLRCDAEVPPPLALSSICFRNSSALIWLTSSSNKGSSFIFNCWVWMRQLLKIERYPQFLEHLWHQRVWIALLLAYDYDCLTWIICYYFFLIQCLTCITT